MAEILSPPHRGRLLIGSAVLASVLLATGCAVQPTPHETTPTTTSSVPSVSETPPTKTTTAPETLGSTTTVTPEESPVVIPYNAEVIYVTTPQVQKILGSLAIKGRAPKTGYARNQFGEGWGSVQGCETRQYILRRDLTDKTFDADNCKVLSGKLLDPYSNKTLPFLFGKTTSDDIQIDHVVSLSNAWQTGAQQLKETERPPTDAPTRVELANDHLNLLATEGALNNQKGDGDFATWKPPYKPVWCAYVARQVLVKNKYNLWVTPPEHDAMQTTLKTCPDETFALKN